MGAAIVSFVAGGVAVWLFRDWRGRAREILMLACDRSTANTLESILRGMDSGVDMRQFVRDLATEFGRRT